MWYFCSLRGFSCWSLIENIFCSVFLVKDKQQLDSRAVQYSQNMFSLYSFEYCSAIVIFDRNLIVHCYKWIQNSKRKNKINNNIKNEIYVTRKIKSIAMIKIELCNWVVQFFPFPILRNNRIRYYFVSQLFYVFFFVLCLSVIFLQCKCRWISQRWVLVIIFACGYTWWSCILTVKNVCRCYFSQYSYATPNRIYSKVRM